jgi:NADH:ubiquinone oxidoreductase subunit F (NADH-binding)
VVAVDALTYPGFKALAALYHLELLAIPARKMARIWRRYASSARDATCGRCTPCRPCITRWAGC